MAKSEWATIGVHGTLLSRPLINRCCCCEHPIEENEMYLELSHKEGDSVCKKCIKLAAKRLGLMR